MNKEPQSFEVAPYSDVGLGINEAFKVIKQIMGDLQRDAPAHAVWADMAGDKLKIHYLTYVAFLPANVKRVEEECDLVFKSTASYLKREFKARTGKALKLAEVRELANHSVEKTSLNERYYYKAWRFYDISF